MSQKVSLAIWKTYYMENSEFYRAWFFGEVAVHAGIELRAQASLLSKAGKLHEVEKRGKCVFQINFL